jgi:hypothetical protein
MISATGRQVEGKGTPMYAYGKKYGSLESFHGSLERKQCFKKDN